MRRTRTPGTRSGLCIVASGQRNLVAGLTLISEASAITRSYTGPDASALTVGGELNKLASNIGFGRDFAGVHWRSDFTASMLRGEDVAVSMLEDWGFTYNENFPGFEFTDFRNVRRTGIGRRK